MQTLLIGNGSSAMSKRMGREIDEFDGTVVRFNAYQTDGYEEFVGTRTDVWVTVGDYRGHTNREYQRVLWVSLLLDHQIDKRFEEFRTKAPYAKRVPYSTLKATKDTLGCNVPSSGAVVTTLFLDEGEDVWLYGFDFMQPNRKHHYSDDVERGPNHSPDHEWLFFHRLIEEGKVHLLGFDPTIEGIPIVRQPLACGSDEDSSAGRAPTQMGWYDWIGERETGKTILDVGAGMCDGMLKMEEYGCIVSGFEVDDRLKGLTERLSIGGGLDQYEDDSFDIVSCVDVIEHVVKDRTLLEDMKRIARERVYVSTPNFSRSRAQSIAHCREYTIGQFMNVFSPDQMWVAAPDGWTHRTLLIDETRRVELDEKFDDTADGLEWAHFCAVFEER